MRFPAAAFAAGLLAVASPALAQAPTDPRVREVAYEPGAVYPVAGAWRTATQIIFSPRETIRHAAIGDSVAWEVAAEGSVLFLKPRERHPATNLLVVTDRDGEARHYAFELQARDPDARGPVAWQIRFRYPGDDQTAAAGALAAMGECVRASARRRMAAVLLRPPASSSSPSFPSSHHHHHRNEPS